MGKNRKFFGWFIMGLLFVALLGFGGTGLTGTVRTVGEVGNLPISTQAYFNELQNSISVRQSQLGRAVSFPEAEAEGLPQRALASIVNQRMLDNEVAELGVSVGDELISAQVLANPAFRGAGGNFDRERYRELLATNNLSEREYETSLRETAVRAMLQGAVFTGIPAPDTFGDTFAQFTREGRSFTWAPLVASDLEIVLPEPSATDLQEHYDANPALYTSLETRQIRYVWLTPDMIQDDVPVDEAELRIEYDARLDEFVQAERRLVERLVFPSEEEAQAAIDAINAGETTFADLVSDRGLTLNDVDIGDVTEAQMGDAGPAIFALENGDTTGPFTSEFGPALFRMNAVLAARNITFEEALPDLREDEAAARARRMIEDQIDPIINLLAGGATLEDVVEQTDMVLGEIEWTTEVSDGIAAYAAFRDLAQQRAVTDFPELADLDDGGLFAIDVVDIRAPALIPLDDIQDEVVAGWEAEQTTASVMAEAEAKAAQLNETVSDFAALSLDAIAETAITRRGFINGTPPNFMTEVFEMEIGEVRVLQNEGGAVVVRLDEVVAPDETDETFIAERALLSETAGEGMAQDIYELFGRTVQMRTDVYINDQALNAVHSNFR